MNNLKEQERQLIIDRIDGICQRMQELDDEIKKESAFHGWINYFANRVMPIPEDVEKNQVSHDIDDVYSNVYYSRREEKNQLFELYQLCLKELHELDREVKHGN